MLEELHFQCDSCVVLPLLLCQHVSDRKAHCLLSVALCGSSTSFCCGKKNPQIHFTSSACKKASCFYPLLAFYQCTVLVLSGSSSWKWQLCPSFWVCCCPGLCLSMKCFQSPTFLALMAQFVQSGITPRPVSERCNGRRQSWE